MLSNPQLVKIAFVTTVLLVTYNNCTQDLGRSINLIEVSLDCGQSQFVSNKELQQLVAQGHSPDSGKRVKCPEFFASLGDE